MEYSLLTAGAVTDQLDGVDGMSGPAPTQSCWNPLGDWVVLSTHTDPLIAKDPLKWGHGTRTQVEGEISWEHHFLRVLALEDVKRVAHLARIALRDDEALLLEGELRPILEYFDRLSKADVKGVEMTVHPIADRDQWRKDEARPGLTREQAVANAPRSEQNFFQVPPVIE